MHIFLLLSVASVAAWVVYSRWWVRRRGGEFPPGPPRLPIVGNIFQLGLNPHKSLAQLAKKYGPLMSLQLGTQFVVVVSSPEMATETMQKQGHLFSNRSVPDAVRVHGHDQISVASLPAKLDRWNKLRRIVKEKLFCNEALEAGQGLRRKRLRKLVEHAAACSDEGRVMNVGEATFTAMFGLMYATLFSVEYGGGGDSSKKFKEHVDATTRYIGVPNMSDFFPIVAPFDPQGIRRKMRHHIGSLLEIVDAMTDRRLQERTALNYRNKNDLLETLLDLMEGNDYDLTIQEIKHLCLDMIIAGSDTSGAITEWTMVELLLHPEKLERVKCELKSVVGEGRMVEESDISRLPYLQATIKEASRYHPIAPLLGPRESVEETRVNGFIIPKKTKLIVNFWAITRDPTVWKNPDCFEPQRFLDNGISFGGQHSELIPFGSGRRICPGLPLANRMVHTMVANLCHNFDWELQGGVESEQLQRADVFGLALQKKYPLKAIPVKKITSCFTFC